MNDVIFTLAELAKLIDVNITSILRWRRRGILDGSYLFNSAYSKVTGKDVAEFLYFNPKYRVTMESANIGEVLSHKRDIVLSYFKEMPHRLYTISELSDILQVREGTICRWFETGKLHGTKTEQSLSKRLFREDDVINFIFSSTIYYERYSTHLSKLQRKQK